MRAMLMVFDFVRVDESSETRAYVTGPMVQP